MGISAIVNRMLLAAALLLLLIAQASMEYISENIQHSNFNGLQANGIFNRRLLEEPIDCDSKCEERCKAAAHHERCTRACGTCCKRCKCVPPGTSGNREVCGSCYVDMKSHNNQTKCP